MSRLTGVVKFFNDEKGYGFISPSDGGKDIFVHRSELAEGVDTLVQDQRVSFAVINSNRKKGDGKMASAVKID